MTIELLDRSALAVINQKLRYTLMAAEKDYFLALVSKIIYDSPLKDRLVFKGGTALYHTYLPQLRFSEDLDFSANRVPVSLTEVKAIFEPYPFLSVKKDYLSGATVKIERLLYTGPLGHANSLKVEIDFLQNVALPPIEMNYHNEYGIKTKVRVMDKREIAAEKIRAMNDRVRYRDFYDFSMIVLKIGVDLDEVLELVKQKEIRKTISPRNILGNWKLAKQDKQDEYLRVRFTEELADEIIEKQIRRLRFEDILK